MESTDKRTEDQFNSPGRTPSAANVTTALNEKKITPEEAADLHPLARATYEAGGSRPTSQVNIKATHKNAGLLNTKTPNPATNPTKTVEDTADKVKGTKRSRQFTPKEDEEEDKKTKLTRFPKQGDLHLDTILKAY